MLRHLMHAATGSSDLLAEKLELNMALSSNSVVGVLICDAGKLAERAARGLVGL